ncbi:MAG TPA: CGGC domain-containing protein [Desulfobacter postgatei]|nr:CGGC domain-containing protein [Desulfobacter postgatei]
MEKILIVGCKKAMDDVCIGCSRCLVGFNRKEGEFAAYKDKDAEIMGMINCGDCPGATIVTRLAQVSLWNKPMGEKATKVHVAPCILITVPIKIPLFKKSKQNQGLM